MQDYNFETTLDMLRRMETPENVEKFRFQGLDFWPLFRMLLLYRRTEVKAITGDPNHLSATTKLKLKLLKWMEKLTFVSKGQKPTGGKVWALYDEVHYEQLHDGRRYHKFLDPLVEKDPEQYFRISLKGNAEHPDFLGTPKWKVSDSAHHDYFWMVDRLKLAKDLGAHFKGLVPPDIAEHVPFNRFLRSASYVVYYADIFGKLMDVYRPESILMAGYFDELKFGIVHAAKRRGIPVVDVQNGAQGTTHIMYRHWNVPIRGGYSTLPDVFLCWSEFWADRLRQSLSPLKQQVTVKTGGHPWYGKLASIIDGQKFSNKPFIPKNKPTALFAVQPANFRDTVDFLLDAMDADKERFWMIRFHSRMVGEIRHFMEELEGYENRFDIVEATRMPLWEAISAVDVVVSFWSTVLLDALYIGKPAVVAHPNGKITFEDLIARGHLYYADSADEFTRIADNLPRNAAVVVPELETPAIYFRDLLDNVLLSEKVGV